MDGKVIYTWGDEVIGFTTTDDEGNTTLTLIDEVEEAESNGCPHCGYMDCEWPDAKCVSDTQAYERDRKNWLDRLVE